MITIRKIVLASLTLGLLAINTGQAQSNTAIKTQINQKAESLEKKVVAWRRDFHQNPELGNREFQTSAKVAAHLRSLGMEVQVNVAKTGVVGLL